MIELSHVTFRYDDMLMDFDISVPKDSLTAIIGPAVLENRRFCH